MEKRIYKQNFGKRVVVTAGLLTAFSIAAGATDVWGTGEFPRLTDPADVPQTLEEIWTGYRQAHQAGLFR